MDTFEPFSLAHLIVALAFVATCAISIAAARWASDSSRRRAERLFGWATVALFLAVNHENWLFTDRLDPVRSLPLHVCDLALLSVPFAFIRSWWPARVVLYYFGLLLSSQGLFTPDLDDGPARWGFWSFWLLHFAVIGGAVYDIAARGFRPTWRALGLAVIVGVVYVGTMVTVNVLLGWNYGYVGPLKPEKPSIIDALGPWPRRVFVMSGLTMILMTLATIPWEIARTRRARDE